MESSLFATSSENREFRHSWKLAKDGLFPPTQIDKLFELFRPRESDLLAIIRYLSSHRRLIIALLNARHKIRDAFGNVGTHLEIVDDPNGGYAELFCVIVTRQGVEEALALLHKFDEEWLLRADRYIRTNLNFTVDTEDGE